MSELFEDLGPDAPTLCTGWKTRDLAAHLLVRERRLDAAPGILVPALAPHTQRVQDSYAARPWAEMVELVRAGPAWYWPTAIGPLDELTNGSEFLVHHEDVRRAQPGWEPRPADPVRDAAAWKSAKQAAKLNLRKSPVGVILKTPEGREARVKDGPETVTVVGDPMELLLFVFGRDAVQLTFEGDAYAVDRLRKHKRGI